MPDPYSGAVGSTKQEINILNEARQRVTPRGQTAGQKAESGKKKDKEKKEPTNAASLYNQGIELLKTKGYYIELEEGGHHINHRILKPTSLAHIEGIDYPSSFKPLMDISDEKELETIDKIFNESICGAELREFWLPVFRPQAGETPFSCFVQRRLKMMEIQRQKEIHDILKLDHTFDPMGRFGGDRVHHPKIWVPDREWFKPEVRQLTFSDVFTIFPPAEQELLKLIIGRIGVGRTNHLPPGMKDPVKHTARMAAIIVGKDPGLGKSTIFNGMTAAFSKCGFITHTFKDVENRFGLKAAALSNIAYKDDTSLQSLKKFLASESTKILVTNGLFETEEKFQNPEQVQPRTVIIANSNDWNSKFAYDLDPGIIDRIKVISTYREKELISLRENLKGTVSEGSPDLRPYAHIPYLAEKLGVSQDAIYLWCLRLATDRFWEIINDTEDPTANRLQIEVRYWTARQRIRFKADVIQSIINSMAFSHALRTNPEEGREREFMKELNGHTLYEYLQSLYFVAVDPSCQPLMEMMKASWEDAGRPSTHYYQGFRELRLESVKVATANARDMLFNENNKREFNKDTVSLKLIKDMIETLVLRDGFKMGGEANYVIENWQNCRQVQEELIFEARKLTALMEEKDRERLHNKRIICEDTWMYGRDYSPDNAEVLRIAARDKLMQKQG